MSQKKIYQVVWEPEALKQLKELDKSKINKLYEKTNQVLSQDPYLGKMLSGKWKGFRRFRFSEYRIIYKIVEEKVLVFVAKVSNRKDVYD